jgi:ABC-type uncharacterized transport system involved in gliding motility auxiliary subunit/ABC-type transport system involved in multi-copper enzyme maturation permease subunit
MKSWNKVRAIAKREFFAYFNSALAYVFLCAFLVIGALFKFKFANWFSTNEASMRAFFNFHPYLYLFFIPALGMRVWAEEDKEGTLELLLTMPISAWHAVTGKFLAGWLFIAFSLALSFPIVFTVAYFGDPDWGRMLSGYLGSWLVGGLCFSLTSLTSAFTRNQVISYLFGFSILLAITIIGMPQVALAEYLKGWFPQDLIETLIFFSIQPHFEGLERGVFDLRDLIYFGSFIIYGLLSSITILRFRKAAHKNNTVFSVVGIIVFSVILLLTNFLTRNMNVRSDLTADKLYTLTPSTVGVMSRFEAPVTVRFYYSKSNKNQAVTKKAFAVRIQDLLKEYAALSKGYAQVKVIDPAPGSIEEKGAALDGIEPIRNDDGTKSYLGVSLSYRDAVKTIPLLTESQSDKLEYYLTNLFRHLQQPTLPSIGVMTDIPIVEQQANPMAGNSSGRPAWKILDALRQDYQIRQIADHYKDWGYDSKTGKNILDLVIIYQFKSMTESSRFALDQYLLRGGKALIFTDSFPLVGPEADKTFNFQKDRLPYRGNTLGVTEAWKISFRSDKLLVDEENATKTSTGKSGFMLSLEQDDFNKEFQGLQDVEKVIFPYAGYFTYEETPGITVTPLVWTSKAAKELPIQSFRDKKVLDSLKARDRNLPLVLRVQGKLKSFYRGRPLKASGVLKSPQKDSDVILVGDMDWLKDEYTFVEVRKVRTREEKRISDNTEFFLNLVDTLVANGSMIDVRMRREKKRELEALKEKRVDIQKEYLSEIKELQTNFKSFDSVVKDFHRKQENQLTLSKDEMAQLVKAEEELAAADSRLAEISQILGSAEGRYQNKIVFINAFAVPFLILISWACMAVYRKRRLRK